MIALAHEDLTGPPSKGNTLATVAPAHDGLTRRGGAAQRQVFEAQDFDDGDSWRWCAHELDRERSEGRPAGRVGSAGRVMLLAP
jgi:hypothetical protein